RFPYGVRVTDASFITDESHGGLRLISFKQLDLTLAKLPLHRGPLVIESLRVREPVIRIVKTEGGDVVGAHLVKRGQESPPPNKKLKLSDILRLRQFDIDRATVTYEDRSRPQSLPMEWRDLDAR